MQPLPHFFLVLQKLGCPVKLFFVFLKENEHLSLLLMNVDAKDTDEGFKEAKGIFVLGFSVGKVFSFKLL